METKPTHEQAQLHLQVYEMRRETRLRQARDFEALLGGGDAMLAQAFRGLFATDKCVWHGKIVRHVLDCV